MRTTRTVFLPKIKNAKEPGDFRPITIPSVMTRCLHKVLAARTSEAIKIDDRQRAFRSTDGCRDNTFLLDLILKYHHKRFKDIYLASLDVKKAFDSVSHIALMSIMRALGCPSEYMEYVRNTYEDGSTTLEGDGWKSKPIKPEKGVKQGDPLSPIIFNMIMDQLLKKLSPEIGCRVGGECVNAAAFADDLILFATTPKGLQSLIDTATEFLKACGMTINADKSTTIGIRANAKLKKTARDIEMEFVCEGRTLRTLGRGEEIKYLGVKFTPQGRARFKPQDIICPGLEELTRAPLKPQQRLFALRFALIPRVYYHLALSDVTISALKKVDVQVRQSVRKWLNLPHDVPTAYFHAEVKDGGLGIPSLRWTAPLHRMGRLTSLKGHHDQLRDDEMDRYLDEEIDKCKKRQGNSNTLMTKMDDVKKWWAERLYKSVDGVGLRESNTTPQQHQWIADGTRILQGKDFIQCVKARIGALPTRSRTTRGRYADRRCRAGCSAQETLNHVVQHCHRTHGMRIRRHDAITSYVARNLRHQGYEVQIEPKYPTSEGLRKPDIVATLGRTTIVVDAQVVSEQTALDEAHKRKVEYYSMNDTLVAAIKEKEKSQEVKFHSVTLSWRGVWSSKSAAELLGLGVIRKAELKILSTRALIGTIAGFNLFSRITTVRRVGVG
ncbi:Retrovirus-related Pol polyprotein from type-2 retrotransposable element R2DM [Anthophora plagiata]